MKFAAATSQIMDIWEKSAAMENKLCHYLVFKN